MENLTRRNIRYICFRLQTEAQGGAKADKEAEGIMQYVYKVREHLESQDDFGGWDKFAKTWDVDEKSPLVAVRRTSSIHSQWNKVLKDEAEELSAAEGPKKFLENELQTKVEERRKKSKSSFWDKLK